MGRSPCCAKVGLRKGAWSAQEDEMLIKYIKEHGEGQWKTLPQKAGLLRCGKSCRLRWKNYLKPDIKRGNITPDEEDLIIRMHKLLGNKWSLIAGRLGRTDNEIKNYWNIHISRRLESQGIDHPTTCKKKSKNMKENSGVIHFNVNNSVKNKNTKTNLELDEQKSVTVDSLLMSKDFEFSKSKAESVIGSCSQENQGGLGYCAEVADDFAWPILECGYDSAACFLSTDYEGHNNGIVNNYELGNDFLFPMTELEKLKEEYLQILKAEDH